MFRAALIVSTLLLLPAASLVQAAPPSDAGLVTSYVVSASSGTFTALSGATPVAEIETKDASSEAIPLGFTFWFMGVPYTQVWANSNGHLSFNAAAWSTSTASMRINSLAGGSATLRPMLAPLWDDLSGAATGTASYLTTGSAGSRVFTFEWLSWKWNAAAAHAVISFQVRLHEATGAIEFIYRQEPGAVNLASASIGIAATGTGSGNYLSLQDTSPLPVVSSTSEKNSLAIRPASGQVYTFTPPVVVPAAPTGLSFTGVGHTAMTLNWTDVALDEAGYTILRSTDGVNYTFLATTAADAVSYAATDLVPG
ncbi:MAG: fibronectin type III domain-containing protein, partial [Planctomycetota bacterium]